MRRRLPHNRVVVLANKCEGRIPEENVLEAHQLGLGEPVRISAEHGGGKLGILTPQGGSYTADLTFFVVRSLSSSYERAGELRPLHSSRNCNG